MTKISLFDISTEFRALQDLSIDEVNEETGEVTNNSDLIAKLFNEVQETLANKLDGTMYVIKQLTSDSTALKDEAKRLNAKAKAMDNKAVYLKELMFGALNSTNEKKLKTDKFNFTIKRSESVSVADVDNLPREFVRLKREADKKAIKEVLKSGATVDGCSIDEKFSLGVR